MSDTINITGVDKIEAFRRLYNAARPQGMGFLHHTPEEMTYEQAKAEFRDGIFDYHRGRVMKVRLKDDELWPGAYDRDNGKGAALAALGDLVAQDGEA